MGSLEEYKVDQTIKSVRFLLKESLGIRLAK